MTLDDASNAALRRALWRLHFWAGLLIAPIVLFAAVTGLLYLLTPPVEAWLHRDLDRVEALGAVQPLDAQVAAAQAAHPGQALRFVVPAFGPGKTTQVHLRAPADEHAGHAEHGMAPSGAGAGAGSGAAPAATATHDHGLPNGTLVYVDPYRAVVVGSLPELQRFATWAKKLHASALQGEAWRWPIELAASWMLVLFATGLALWWPRPRAAGGTGWGALRPRWGRGRATWRDLHALVALAMGLVLAVVLLTGLTWSRHAGDHFRSLLQAARQDAPKAPAGLRSRPVDGVAPLNWQAVHERAVALAPPIAMQLTAPTQADGVWRVENFDRSQPTRRFTLLLDAYSGEPRFQTGWGDFPLLSRATAVGIPFHRGEFGLWNQLLLAAAALACVFSVVSGLVMMAKRRGKGRIRAPAGLALAQWRHLPAWCAVTAVLLGLALPVFGWSLLLYLLGEASLAAWRRRPARAMARSRPGPDPFP